MRRSALLALLALGLAACDDNPSGPKLDQPVDTLRPAAVQASSMTFPACTKRWKTGASGFWGVASNWTPGGVPDASSVVCIDAAGSYTVTVAVPDTVAALIVGSSKLATPTLSYAPIVYASFLAPSGIWIRKGSTLRFDTSASSAHFEASQLLVDGAVAFQGGTVTAWDVDSTEITGSMNIPATRAVPIYGSSLRNSGTLTVNGTLAFQNFADPDFRVWMDNGSVTGSGRFLVVGANHGIFHWTGGTLDARMADSVTPVVILTGTGLEFGSTTLHGRIYDQTIGVATAGPDTVWGDIGPGVELWLEPDSAVGFQLVPTAGGPLVNAGTLILERLSGGSGAHGPVRGAAIRNQGSLELRGDSVELGLDSLINEGTLSVQGLHRLATGSGILRNRGTISVLPGEELEIRSAGFVAESGSVQTGTLRLTGVPLSGTGTAGDVISAGGLIEPGLPRGTLHLNTLTLDAASGVGIDIAGTAPGSFDQLITAGKVSYAGTLTLREAAPFQSGTCGQLLPILLDHTVGPRGLFTKFVGLTPGAGRGWRFENPRDTILAVGHNPLLLLSRSPAATAVTEGGVGASYSVCLRSAPSAGVTITPSSATGQAAATPTLTFSPASWGRPQDITLSAVDDTVIEPPHQVDDVGHGVTTADPLYANAALSSVAVDVSDNDGSANFELNVLSVPPVVPVGGSFTLSFRATNSGPTLSTGATFTVAPAAGMTLTGITGVTACTTSLTTGISCVVPGVANGAHLDFTLTLRATARGSYPVGYILTGHQPDPAAGNNVKNQTITVN